MADPAGEADRGALRLDFDRRVMLRFHGSVITSDGGLLAYRELDDVLALTASGGERLAETRTGRNRRHPLVGLLRQSVFGRLAGYEDVNDADRLCRDPAMRWVVGDRAIKGAAASASQMGRFETEWLTRPENFATLADLPGQWIDTVHRRRPPRIVVLDMDSSESPTYGEQEGSAYNGHFSCTCYHPLFLFNQLGDLERCALRPGNVHSADGWYWSGWLRLFAGQAELAIQHFETSMRLNPRGQRGFHLAGLGSAHFVSHRFEDALAVLRVSLEEAPTFTPTYRTLAACYAQMGRLDEAREIIKRLASLTPMVVPAANPCRNPEHRELFQSGLRLAAGEAV